MGYIDWLWSYLTRKISNYDDLSFFLDYSISLYKQFIDSRYMLVLFCRWKPMFDNANVYHRSIVLLMTWLCCVHNGSYSRRRKKNLRCTITHVRATLCFKRKQEIETRTLLLTDFILVILCHTNTSSSNEDLVGKGFCSSSFQFSYRSSSVYLKCECRRYQGWK